MRIILLKGKYPLVIVVHGCVLHCVTQFMQVLLPSHPVHEQLQHWSSSLLPKTWGADSCDLHPGDPELRTQLRVPQQQCGCSEPWGSQGHGRGTTNPSEYYHRDHWDQGESVTLPLGIDP